ncbi:hypothetical protein Pst134EB_022149 [Puccinia striiformis f. sp. tritici]|nr:hypothetical protein Pst134EB_022149 [Puccinia striiformis f. sp. tritici]
MQYECGMIKLDMQMYFFFYSRRPTPATILPKSTHNTRYPRWLEGRVQKAGKRVSRAKPQNLRPDSGKFDVRKSSIKRLTDWDQEEAQDEQDDFFDGLDKVSLQQTGRDTRFETTWTFPNSSWISMTVRR